MALRTSAVSIAFLMIVGVAALSACGPQPTSTETSTTSPPACGTAGQLSVVTAGDSIVAGWSPRLALGASVNVISTAKGGAGFTTPTTGDPATSSNITELLLAQLDACHNDVDLVIVSGGANDLNKSQPIAALTTAVAALDAELRGRGIPVVWLPITPYALGGGATYDVRYDTRLAYNEWLRTSTDVHGTVLECNAVLQDPATAVESLRPAFYTWADTTTPDRWHPNNAGYQAFANCLSPAVTAVLTAAGQ